VQVVEVDVIGAQPGEAGVHGLPDVLGLASAGLLVGAELGGQHDFVAAVGQQSADELLVVALAVDVGGVEEVDPEVEQLVEQLRRFGVVGGAVDAGQAHRAVADGADLGTVAAESATWGSVGHGSTPDRVGGGDRQPSPGS
jgi:hypothetical protein